jgi:altronate hydrolase
MVNDFKQYFIAHNQPIYENPSPGNKAGGITTLEDNRWAARRKRAPARWWTSCATANVESARPEPAERPGQRCGRHQRAGRRGCHMVLFSTGRGTPYGGFVPTVKIATNSELAAKKKHWIDFDAGQLIHGKAMPSCWKSLSIPSLIFQRQADLQRAQ